MARDLEAAGVGLVAISYDPPAALRAFADGHGIGFPLLADEGSRVISELGLLDRDLVAHHARFGVPTEEHQRGVAYPAVFVLDRDGVVVQRRIQEHYRAREAASVLLEEGLAIRLPARGPAAQGGDGPVAVSVAADADHYVRWQRTRLRVAIEVQPGWHVYGRPIPDGYTALSVEVDAIPEVEVEPAILPDPHPFRVEGLDEAFVVHEGRLEVSVPFAVNVPPGHGEVELAVHVHLQACSSTECLPPTTLTFPLTLPPAPPP